MKITNFDSTCIPVVENKSVILEVMLVSKSDLLTLSKGIKYDFKIL